MFWFIFMISNTLMLVILNYLKCSPSLLMSCHVTTQLHDPIVIWKSFSLCSWPCIKIEHEYHCRDLSDGQLSSMLERLFLEDHGTVKVLTFFCVNDFRRTVLHKIMSFQSYLWNDNEVVVKWFESDMAKEEGSVIAENIKWIKRDSVLRQIKS